MRINIECENCEQMIKNDSGRVITDCDCGARYIVTVTQLANDD